MSLVVPSASATTDPYRAIVLDEACVRPRGGAYGHGYLELVVKAKEIGASGTNYFVIKSKLETSTGAGWGTVMSWPVEYSSTFPDDTSNYYRIVDRRKDLHKSEQYAYRIVIKVQFWSNRAGLLAIRTAKLPCI